MPSAASSRPNILWITCEDISPILGCYGDRYAHTPNLDRLAAEGTRYTRAFSAASVCAPARSSLITGVQANTLGTMHLRGVVPLARGINCFPAYLRRAGYYCSNNVKQDYNFTAPADAWDESSKTAHWRNRRSGQPFFAVFNLTATHQGQIRYPREEFERVSAKMAPEERHDPAKAPLPPYYPDTPMVRLNIAELYTQATVMDKQAGDLLQQLQSDGLAGDTVVFFFSDHGTGLPRDKRWLHDSGTRVPLLIRFPEKYGRMAPGKPGSATDRLVTFLDFAPTVLSLAGIDPPVYMQGSAFLGERPGKPRDYAIATRDRVDEVLEISRAVRDLRYHYIRNFLPHRPRMQHSLYSEVGHVRKELRRLHAEGKLSGDQAFLLNPGKPAEELYDTQADPHEIRNLAGSPAHQAVLERLRKELRTWMVRTRDTGLLPEDDMIRRAEGGSPKDMPTASYPVERVFDAADLVGRGPAHAVKLLQLLSDGDSAVRYWSAVGLTALGSGAKPAAEELRKALSDAAPAVRIAAAEALVVVGQAPEAIATLSKCVLDPEPRVALQAAIALWYLGEKARSAVETMRQALAVEGGPSIQRTYTRDAIRKTLLRLDPETPGVRR
ncbi:MAG: sulfatase-like hydrolase/transferase [Acidobacteria bacterium]|nr:sulfatase-like hydrolase/transferase [Acidobacteriota bacterium]